MRTIKRFNENFFKDAKDFLHDPTGKKRREEDYNNRLATSRASLEEYKDSVEICIEYNEDTEEFENAIQHIENGLIEEVETGVESNKIGMSNLPGTNDRDKGGNFYKILFTDGTEICVMRGHEFETMNMDYHTVTKMWFKGEGDDKFSPLGNGVVPSGATNLGMWGKNSGFISYSSYSKFKNAALEFLDNQ